LINDSNVTEYEIHASPTRSPVFNSGTTSRKEVWPKVKPALQNRQPT
jgi:hypothetical protein